MRALVALADALLAALVLVCLEGLALVATSGHALAGAWEAKQLLRTLPVLSWVALAPVALVGAGIARTALREGRLPRALTVGAALVAGAAAAWGTSFGRHFADPRVRAAWIAIVALSAAGVAAALQPRVAAAARRSPVAVSAIAAVTVLGLVALDHLALPRLYPAFHHGLSALAVVAAVSATRWLEPPARPGAARLAVSSAVVLGLALALVMTPALARSLERADNARFLAVDRGTFARYGAALVARLTEAPPVDAPVELLAEQTAAIDLRGRDVVLLSVDALRADHVGAYGYPRATTPHLDALAAEGVVFTAAYAPTPHTSYSIGSLMTGKYLRPLFAQGADDRPDTLAKLLRGYGYRTAAFYPPAVFFIDADRFGPLRESGLDFEYRRVEFLPAAARAPQVAAYLDQVRPDRRVLVWAHLFEPHEPYEHHAAHDFGDRDVDRYDGEIAAADAGIGSIVAEVRRRRPEAVIVVTADHGEEHGEHGGRYHGTSVYDEQVRVPLVIVAPGILRPARVTVPVQTIDVMPTLLAGLRVPRPARVRGRDLGPLLAGRAPEGDLGLAFAETDDATLLAEGSLRLVCARRAAACQLFDVATDPGETRDVAPMFADRFAAMKQRQRALAASHGKYEALGLRREGKAWPEALRRGMAGDADAAPDVAALLDDADVGFRRKAAEVLFELRVKSTERELRLCLSRDEDDEVKKLAALALTRLGGGAARTLELVDDPDPRLRRLAALALAENGDARGEGTLIAWVEERDPSFSRMKELVAALAHLRSRRAALPLTRLLSDVRLGPFVARALGEIGEPVARPALLERLKVERYVPARVAQATALVELGAGQELAAPLARWLGTPDPLPGGLGLARRAGILGAVGGPDRKDQPRLLGRGEAVRRAMVLVPGPGYGKGARLLVLGHALAGAASRVRASPSSPSARDDGPPPEIDARAHVSLELPPGAPVEVFADLPASFAVRPGAPAYLVLERPSDVEVLAFAIVPRGDELPPPPPEPWTPGEGDLVERVVDDGR